MKFAFIDLKKKIIINLKKAKEGQTSRVSDAVYAHQIDMAAGSVLQTGRLHFVLRAEKGRVSAIECPLTLSHGSFQGNELCRAN